MRHQLIQNDVRPGAAVKQIAHNVQLIHGQPLDQRTHCNDKVIRTPGCGNAAENLPVVHILVVVLKMSVQQLIQNVLIALGQIGAHEFPGVLGRHQPAHLNQPHQDLIIPGVQILLFFLQFRQFLNRVINQGCKLAAPLVGHLRPQGTIHFFFDDAGGIVQNMRKCIVFSVQVAHEMLGALGQLQHCLQIDDLAGSLCNVGVILGQQAQIFQVCPHLLGLILHETPLFPGHTSVRGPAVPGRRASPTARLADDSV